MSEIVTLLVFQAQRPYGFRDCQVCEGHASELVLDGDGESLDSIWFEQIPLLAVDSQSDNPAKLVLREFCAARGLGLRAFARIQTRPVPLTAARPSAACDALSACQLTTLS